MCKSEVSFEFNVISSRRSTGVAPVVFIVQRYEYDITSDLAQKFIVTSSFLEVEFYLGSYCCETVL